MASPPSGPCWPPGKLPVELFVIIAKYLGDRRHVQSMRLVNREFNSKLAGYYFRHLVVHLGPELCATLDTGLPLQVDSPTIDVTNRLMDSTCIFDTFGTDILRFGLALELSENDLATPNIDGLEVLEVRPWGVFRWPTYLNTSQSLLEKFTVALEKSRGMFRIMSHLGKVQELALSCEGGLGYLHGPDVNHITPPQKPVVFGDPNTVREGGDAQPLDFDKPYRYEMLERAMRAKDIIPSHIPRTFRQLLESERITMERLVKEERRRCPLPGKSWGLSRYTDPRCECCIARSKTLRLQPDLLTNAQKRYLLQHMSAHQAIIQSYVLGIVDNAAAFVNLTSIKVTSLPSFHVELLCRDDIWSKLPQLEKVFLAVVPDWRQLTKLGPHDVEETQVYPADAMPKVFRLLNDHIGKQKHIKHLHFEWLCGGELSSGRLQRNKHVLPAPFLKSHRSVIDSRVENLLILPFVTHLSLKNCWFTPHVFFRIVREMATKSLESLELETVSLSGPPRGLYSEFYQPDTPLGGTRPYRGPRPNWRGVDPPSRWDVAGQPNAGQLNAGQHNAGQAIGGHNHNAMYVAFQAAAQQGVPHPGIPPLGFPPPGIPPQGVPPQGVPLQAWNALNALFASAHTASSRRDEYDSRPLRKPRELTWAHIIDMLTPGKTIEERLREEEQHQDELLEPLHLEKELKLHKLSFKSCGYVDVPDRRFIWERPLKDAGSEINRPGSVDMSQVFEYAIGQKTLGCIWWFMQANTDRHLADIVPWIGGDEEVALRRAFGFRMGWDDVYDPSIIQSARYDGFITPGRGRFSGKIEHRVEPTPSERYAGVFYADEPRLKATYVENYDTSRFDQEYDDNNGADTIQTGMAVNAGYQRMMPQAPVDSVPMDADANGIGAEP